MKDSGRHDNSEEDLDLNRPLLFRKPKKKRKLKAVQALSLDPPGKESVESHLNMGSTLTLLSPRQASEALKAKMPFDNDKSKQQRYIRFLHQIASEEEAKATGESHAFSEAAKSTIELKASLESRFGRPDASPGVTRAPRRTISQIEVCSALSSHLEMLHGYVMEKSENKMERES